MAANALIEIRKVMRSIVRRVFLEDNEGVGRGTLLAFAWAVLDHAVGPKSRGAATVKINRFLAAKLDEVGGMFGEGHADRNVALTAIDHDEKQAFIIPTDGGAGMAEFEKAAPFRGLAIFNKSRTATQGDIHAGEIGGGFEDDFESGASAEFWRRSTSGAEGQHDGVAGEGGVAGGMDFANARGIGQAGSEWKPGASVGALQ